MFLLIIITSVLITGLFTILNMLFDICSLLKQICNILNIKSKNFTDYTDDKNS